ncbi:MAG: hypothetical protein HY518_01100 [Candidatus Aenigmarchaeota archaeon]|nr:hypothetical protein [Candidatus Aenigmarchaeota archaeon]
MKTRGETMARWIKACMVVLVVIMATLPFAFAEQEDSEYEDRIEQMGTNEETEGQLWDFSDDFEEEDRDDDFRNYESSPNNVQETPVSEPMPEIRSNEPISNGLIVSAGAPAGIQENNNNLTTPQPVMAEVFLPAQQANYTLIPQLPQAPQALPFWMRILGWLGIN